MRRVTLFLIVLFLAFSPQLYAQEDCAAAPPPRLRSGMIAQTSAGQPNNIRAEPDSNADRIGQIPPETSVEILSDATCADGYYWYQIEYQDMTGWTVEGADGDYWLLPVLSDSQIITADTIQQLQILNEFVCPQEDEAIPYSWSPDGTRLLWGCDPSSLSLTDWVNQETIALELPDHWSNRLFTSFSGDGSAIMAYDNPEVFYWDAETGEMLAETRMPSGFSLNSFATYGDVLAIGTQNAVHLYDLLSLEPIDSLEDEALGYVNAAAFSPDGTRLAIGGTGDTVIWTLETGEVVTTAAASPVQSLRFTPSGRYVLAASCVLPERGECNGAEIAWINAETGAVFTRWQQDDWYEVDDMGFAEDMVFIQANGRVDAVQISTDERVYQSESRAIKTLVSRDGRLLLVGEGSRIVVYGVP